MAEEMNALEKEIFDFTVAMIRDYVPSLANPESLTMESTVNSESNIDSMGYILVISKIEAQYGIEISERQIAKLVTMGDLVRFVEKKVAKQTLCAESCLYQFPMGKMPVGIFSKKKARRAPGEEVST